MLEGGGFLRWVRLLRGSSSFVEGFWRSLSWFGAENFEFCSDIAAIWFCSVSRSSISLRILAMFAVVHLVREMRLFDRSRSGFLVGSFWRDSDSSVQMVFLQTREEGIIPFQTRLCLHSQTTSIPSPVVWTAK